MRPQSRRRGEEIRDGLQFLLKPSGWFSPFPQKQGLEFKLIAAGRPGRQGVVWGSSPRPRAAGHSENKGRGASYRTRPTGRQGRIVLLISQGQGHGLASLVPRAAGVQLRAGQSCPISSCICALAWSRLLSSSSPHQSAAGGRGGQGDSGACTAAGNADACLMDVSVFQCMSACVCACVHIFLPACLHACTHCMDEYVGVHTCMCGCTFVRAYTHAHPLYAPVHRGRESWR